MGTWPTCALLWTLNTVSSSLSHCRFASGNATAATAAGRPSSAPTKACLASARSRSLATLRSRSTAATTSALAGCREVQPSINCLLSGNLILDHPALKVGLASFATEHLEESVRQRQIDRPWQSTAALWPGGTPHQSQDPSISLSLVFPWMVRLYRLNGLRWQDHGALVQSGWYHTIRQLHLNIWASWWCHRSLEVLLWWQDELRST